ncbi:hypothetical protein ABFG95_02100 [Achromobacter sp. HNDS-1]|uniref:DUF7661 domain-containing protein n=1 Tax=Achromobacter sp. HNDS-1 TaxID=3151598 RepID=A0AAU7LBR0_9BURK|nr:hypothetical protein [Achromobacter ruhlandii]
MRFDIYRRLQLDIEREAGQWAVYQSVAGKRVRAGEIVIPADVAEDELATYLDDLYHEMARPGDSVTRVA